MDCKNSLSVAKNVVAHVHWVVRSTFRCTTALIIVRINKSFTLRFLHVFLLTHPYTCDMEKGYKCLIHLLGQRKVFAKNQMLINGPNLINWAAMPLDFRGQEKNSIEY